MRKALAAARHQVGLTISVRIPAAVTRAATSLPTDREVQDQALYTVALAATVYLIISGCR